VRVERRKLAIITRFELAEALRSRLVVVVLCLYGLGAAFGAFAFVKALEAAERSVRASLDQTLSAHDLPDASVQRDAIVQILSHLVQDRELLADLVAVDPLALFYGFMALQLVAPFVLLTSAGAPARDLRRGSTRFVLTRCDRLTWALGKTLAHAALLALGLLVSALATAAVGLWLGRFDLLSVLWIGRAVFRALIYGLAYLGIFTGISLAVRAPGPAVVACVGTLFGLWFVHGLTRWTWLGRELPGLSALAWLFPAEYQELLWSPSWLVSGAAALALAGIGALAFASGHWLFRRADA
jgi:ABC-type transport system involved in multi-copper enzyme maturation permease subunit